MFHVLIIEDEQPSADNLISLLKQADPSIHVDGVVKTVRESIDWLKTQAPPSLLFMDIQLNDGLSFAIFEEISLSIPVIFITGYDTFLIEAFEHNGIDYLLKPLNRGKIQKAIDKYKNLQAHFLFNYNALTAQLQQSRSKKRISVKRGTEIRSVRHEDIAYIFTEDKVVFLVTKEGEKFLVNKRLRDLEGELDTNFYRANRKYIINIEHVKKIKQLESSRLQIELSVPMVEPILISPENATSFKMWMDNL